MSQINTTTIRCSRSEKRWLCYLKIYFTLGLFTCSLLHCVHAAVGLNDPRFVYDISKTDAAASAENTDTNIKLLEEIETDQIPEGIDPQLGIHENVKRDAVTLAKAAECTPENTMVDLIPIHPIFDYFPHCTRVKRCGGCCNTQLKSCQPTETEIVNFKVQRYCYNKVKPEFCGFEKVSVEQHLGCKCDCRIKRKDCNSYQRYQDCRCNCINGADRDKCLSLENKFWDDVNCRCVCIAQENCTTGTYYDENQCKCVLPPSNNDQQN